MLFSGTSGELLSIWLESSVVIIVMPWQGCHGYTVSKVHSVWHLWMVL